MSLEQPSSVSGSRVVVVGNEKGGSGKSTVAMHVAVALLKAKQRVASIDLDLRQKTFTNYIVNRYAWGQQIGRDLGIPNHLYFTENTDHPTAEDEAADGKALSDRIEGYARDYDFVVIDTPGHNSYLGRLAHSRADLLITPLNDSFVDLDVLGTVDRETFALLGTSHYSQMVEEARRQYLLTNNVKPDWIVLRNRLSTLSSRNTRSVGDALGELSRRLGFRQVEGLAERVIFREFYARGLTAFDNLDEATLGVRPTPSHVAARFEIESLLVAMGLNNPASGDLGRSRDAA